MASCGEVLCCENLNSKTFFAPAAAPKLDGRLNRLTESSLINLPHLLTPQPVNSRRKPVDHFALFVDGFLQAEHFVVYVTLDVLR